MRRRSAWPASRSAFRSRSKARCRANYVTTVTLKTSDGDEVTKEVRIAPMGRTSDWLDLEAEGDRRLHAHRSRFPSKPTRLLADNNQLSAPIAIREEKLRVLVVESYPRWEYRYLRNALSRDPGVEVSCLLFHPGLSKVGGGNKDYIKQFPVGPRRASKYDVVFLGDVGVERRPADRRAMPAAQGAGRASGQRPGLHAGDAGQADLAAGHRAWRTCARSCSIRRSRAAGARGRRATSN